MEKIEVEMEFDKEEIAALNKLRLFFEETDYPSVITKALSIAYAAMLVGADGEYVAIQGHENVALVKLRSSEDEDQEGD